MSTFLSKSRSNSSVTSSRQRLHGITISNVTLPLMFSLRSPSFVKLKSTGVLLTIGNVPSFDENSFISRSASVVKVFFSFFNTGFRSIRISISYSHFSHYTYTVPVCQQVFQFFVKFFYFTSATVSRQIASSSLVGITATFTLESAVEITRSSPLWLFSSLSSFTPR